MPSRIKTISNTQIDTLLSHCYCTWHRAILAILADTGLRVSELVSLLQQDLWIAKAPTLELDVPGAITKTGSPRSIPLTLRASDAIRDLRAALWPPIPGPYPAWAFPAKNPYHHKTTRTIQRIVHKYGLISLNTTLTPHMLRHTFATRLMRKTNIRVVQQLLGHKSLSSTQIYTHPNTQDLKQAIATLES